MDVEMESPVKKSPETVHDSETQIFSEHEQNVNTCTSQCIKVIDIAKLSAHLKTLGDSSENEESILTSTGRSLSPLDLSKSGINTTDASISYGLSSMSVNEDGEKEHFQVVPEKILMEAQSLPISSPATDEIEENEECILPDFTESQQWQMKMWNSTANMNNSQKNLIQVGDESVPVRVIDGPGFSKNFIEVGPISDIVGDVDIESLDEKECGFRCNVCPESFDKKLLLNNHMKGTHGVNYVFTERGRKVKLVRLPEEENKVDQEDVNDQEEQSVEMAEQATNDNEGEQKEENEEQGLGCGYVCKIDTLAYQKAIKRQQIPFVAFIPILPCGISQGYLLRIKNYGCETQLLEPATRQDVIASFLQNTKNGEEAADTVPIVAMAQQIFNKETKLMEISITAPDTEFVAKNRNVGLIRQDKFTSLAFSNPAMEFEQEDEESQESIFKTQHLYFTPPRKPLSPPSKSSPMSKCELDSDDERDNNFIPTPTCAPKAKSVPATKKKQGVGRPRKQGVGRPRKLNFEECSQKDIEKPVEEPLVTKLEEPPLTRLKRKISKQSEVDDVKKPKPKKVSRIA